jgi:integrase
MRTRDRLSQQGLLPRMEARPLRRKPGVFSYRYHPVGGKPIPLGTDRVQALRRVLDITGNASDEGTIAHMWRLYQESVSWKELSERTRDDYTECSKPLLRVFAAVHTSTITQPMVRRYMMVERGGKSRANHEAALLSNLMYVAIDHGYAQSNPCYGLKRVKTKPRKVVPIGAELAAYLKWLRGKGKQWSVIAAMAEFASKAGSRRCEFLRATRFQFDASQARLPRGKQRNGDEVIDIIDLSPSMVATLDSIKRDGCEYIFPTRSGRPYTDSGFKGMWGKAMTEAMRENIVTVRFTFHDLRAHYATLHKETMGALPELHKDTATTARVYDRSKTARRQSL